MIIFRKSNPKTGSAAVAKERLGLILEKDREALPAWRWTFNQGRHFVMAARAYMNASVIGPRPAPQLHVDTRPGYRWERRK